MKQSSYKIDHALCGLVESAMLQYKLLSARFKLLGFTHKPYDRRIFNRLETDGSQYTLCVHIDYIMITAATEQDLDKVIKDTMSFLGDITVTRFKNHDYLGTSFDFSDM